VNLTTVHSLWLAPLCVLLGVLYAWFAYRRSQEQHGWKRNMVLSLGAIRALAVAIIAFFLLEPMVRIWLREVRKPVVVIAHDGSASLAAAGDTAALKTTYKSALEQLADDLGQKYEVRTFTYGQEVSDGLQFDQHAGQTDMDQVLREVYDRLGGPDLGAVIIDGDGIYNRGRDPRFAAERLGVPVYTVALGDTTVRPDLVLKDAEHNRIAFLGNDVPIVARLEARHMNGGHTRVSIRQGDAELAGKDLVVPAIPSSRSALADQARASGSAALHRATAPGGRGGRHRQQRPRHLHRCGGRPAEGVAPCRRTASRHRRAQARAQWPRGL
jgi:hypothetical protein